MPLIAVASARSLWCESCHPNQVCSLHAGVHHSPASRVSTLLNASMSSAASPVRNRRLNATTTRRRLWNNAHRRRSARTLVHSILEDRAVARRALQPPCDARHLTAPSPRRRQPPRTPGALHAVGPSPRRPRLNPRKQLLGSGVLIARWSDMRCSRRGGRGAVALAAIADAVGRTRGVR